MTHSGRGIDCSGNNVDQGGNQLNDNFKQQNPPPGKKHLSLTSSHSMVHDNFDGELASLRETTRKCIQCFYDDREQRYAKIKTMEERCATLRGTMDFYSSIFPMTNTMGSLMVVKESASMGSDDASRYNVDENTAKSLPTKVVDDQRDVHAKRDKVFQFRFPFSRRKKRHQKRGEFPSEGEQKTENDRKISMVPSNDSRKDTLQTQINEKNSEILQLEQDVTTINHEISILRENVSSLNEGLQKCQHQFEQDRMHFLHRIKKVEFNNENLDRMMIEVEISLEEKKITIEALADELKRVREDLIQVQSERYRRREDVLLMDEINNKELDMNEHKADGVNSRDRRLSVSQFSSVSSVTRDSCTFYDVLAELERLKPT